MIKPKLKSNNLFDQIYAVVKTIPKGKVATYGQIAALVGTKDARKVGWALSANNDSNVPCHRVANKAGMLAENFGKSLGAGGWEEQRRRLLDEGVVFTDKKQADLEKCLWEGK